MTQGVVNDVDGLEVQDYKQGESRGATISKINNNTTKRTQFLQEGDVVTKIMASDCRKRFEREIVKYVGEGRKKI